MIFFGRWRRAGIIDLRPGCGSWRAGELAVCIRDDWTRPHVRDPRAGDVLRVIGTRTAINGSGFHALWLYFETTPRNIGFLASCFRKAVQDRAAASGQFTRQMKRLGRKPVHAKEPA
jgi:hypothetical protein